MSESHYCNQIVSWYIMKRNVKFLWNNVDRSLLRILPKASAHFCPNVLTQFPMSRETMATATIGLNNRISLSEWLINSTTPHRILGIHWDLVLSQSNVKRLLYITRWMWYVLLPSHHSLHHGVEAPYLTSQSVFSLPITSHTIPPCRFTLVHYVGHRSTSTGRERLIRSHSSAMFCFELSGNSN